MHRYRTADKLFTAGGRLPPFSACRSSFGFGLDGLIIHSNGHFHPRNRRALEPLVTQLLKTRLRRLTPPVNVVIGH